MRRQPITVLAAILLGGIALVVAGCGSKSGTKAPAKKAGQASVSTTTASQSLAPSLSLLTAKNCDQLHNVGKSFSAALSGDEKDLDRTAATLKVFAAETPSDIRPDFEVLAAAYAKIISALKGVDMGSSSMPSPAVLARFAKLSNEIDMARVSVASTRMSAWASKNCGYSVPDSG